MVQKDMVLFYDISLSLAELEITNRCATPEGAPDILLALDFKAV